MEGVLWPQYSSQGRRLLYQQDNASIHTSRASKAWITGHGIPLIDWPPHSPDLNPIEHVWKKLKQLVYELHPEFSDLKDNEADGVLAKEWILDVWGDIS